MKHDPIPRRPVTPQDNRLADISASIHVNGWKSRKVPADFDPDLWFDPLTFEGLIGRSLARHNGEYRSLFRADGFAKPKAELMEMAWVRKALAAPEPLPEQYLGVEWDESESAVWSLTTGQFLLASILVCMGAIALVL